MKENISFFQHDLGQPELDAIARVFAGTILTTGDTVARFEEEFARYLGVRYCLGFTSCTGALHASLCALGIGPGDEVITTTLTFIATACAIVSAGAKPVLVDVEPATGNLDLAAVRRAITPRTRAILPVHLYGVMADMRGLRSLADQHHLAIVEDAAHCIEGSRDGVRPGQLGDTAAFSFFATKNMTCGEGGAVVTNDRALYERLRLLRLHGMDKTSSDRFRHGYQHWDMVSFGWKYNMDNIQAAMLLPQMQRLEANWEKRHALAARYRKALAAADEVTLWETPERTRDAYHLCTVRVPPGRRDEVIEGLKAEGVPVMVNYRPIHLTSYFSGHLGHGAGDFPIAEAIGETVISLPFYPRMPADHADAVVEALQRVLRTNRSAPQKEKRRAAA